MINIRKYDIVFAKLDPVSGSEQGGTRPCLVLQNDMANRFSSTTVVATFSSVLKKYGHCLIVEPTATNGLQKISRLDTLQMRTIDRNRIKSKIGILDEQYKDALRKKLYVAFDFNDELEVSD